MVTRLLIVLCLVFAGTDLARAIEDEWQALFDGQSLSGWQLKGGKTISRGWIVEEGAIHRVSGVGDIVTSGSYKDFELELEWKISPGGNSGVKYRFDGNVGPEYQILDDVKHANGANPKTRAAAMYAMFACQGEKALNPVGEFNAIRIVAIGTRLEHWLNGVRVLAVDTASDAWTQAKANSKFKDEAHYGQGAGRILLQDHGDEVWFRNIRIREISADAK